ncbi:MAG TPA: xanthine dehydrogenase family protein molybdopterin-binding subunit [Pelagibacteraceae bacterium]|jgi:carbon-monoxide dehydrogenase large subunit|nr:xanthine dehydrogenase family protein molybdopterin-binding subunit [Pelagibacteraceae bacterium]|tara:strand:- start:2991 stop:5363 length:2373 start_codon:yes stop_codon:yes gene_type:complete
MASLIGSKVERKEDKKFLTGKGRYTADINLARQTYAYFVRSPHARAKINKIDISKALKAPGVVRILTGNDLAKDKIGGLIAGWKIVSQDGKDMKVPPHPPLAKDCVNYVGDHVAIVIAETLEQSKNAADLVDVNYKVLKAVVNTGDAMNSEVIHEGIDRNLCFDFGIGDKGKTDEALSSADKIIKLDLINNRLIPNAMEPRASIGDYNPSSEQLTLYTTSQNPHLTRLVLSAFNAIAPEHKFRVVAPDVGGGFGSKIYPYAEDVVVAWAAKKIERPVKWVAERRESFLSDCHGRDHVTHAELAVKNNGIITGLKVDTIANLGAYASLFATATPTYLYTPLILGLYNIPVAFCNVKAVFTNTAPVDAYRGAGRPEATFLIERIITEAAKEIGVDQAEFRKKNFISKFPHQQCLVHNIDSGDYSAHLEKALELSDYKNFKNRRSESESKGKYRGIGFSTYLEACGIAPSAVVMSIGAGVGLWESAEVRFNATGNVSVFTGTHSHGQGHDTTFAQIVGDKLGIPIENIEIIHGDTDKGPFGMGTYGSRSLAVGGTAIVKACDKIVEKGKKVAAHMLEAKPEDVDFESGEFIVKNSNKKKTIGEIAFACYLPGQFGEIKSPLPEGVEPGLKETSFYDPVNFSFPAGTHICEVEVDQDTGETKVVKYTAVDDFGTIINPLIVEGQVHGGVVQGIGQALYESGHYDETGQLTTASYMDYTMPRADNFPQFKVDYTTTPATSNPLGAKGCGEAGAIAAPPAVMNAVIDAIGTDVSMPATAEKVWKELKKNASKKAAA